MLFDLVHELFAVGYVSRNFGKTVRLSFFVLQGGYYHARPEARPIFPDSPALALEVAMLASSLQHLLWHTRSNVFRAVEPGKALAHNLFGGVAPDAVHPAHPGGDVSIE